MEVTIVRRGFLGTHLPQHLRVVIPFNRPLLDLISGLNFPDLPLDLIRDRGPDRFDRVDILNFAALPQFLRPLRRDRYVRVAA